eukprot:TRINITY_DN39810_c0_g1_i1.p1 TRINITY_DN39810_c0_g1~~TRINITY_DN39810_c0_g1_i1.p1  ORF type:complete len:160 (+),score=24.42 TRINITY_DN39810_c0_g1_i1:33-512(+)
MVYHKNFTYDPKYRLAKNPNYVRFIAPTGVPGCYENSEPKDEDWMNPAGTWEPGPCNYHQQWSPWYSTAEYCNQIGNTYDNLAPGWSVDHTKDVWYNKEGWQPGQCPIGCQNAGELLAPDGGPKKFCIEGACHDDCGNNRGFTPQPCHMYNCDEAAQQI